MAKKSKANGVAKALKKAKGQTVKKREPTSGQSAPPVELSVDALNAKELKVLVTLNGLGGGIRPVLTITTLAETCFKSQGKKKGNSWTRNSLRRLVQSGLVEKVERGKYRISLGGRKKLAKAA